VGRAFDQNRSLAKSNPATKTLWRLCEKVSARLKSGELSGLAVTLKLKTADFPAAHPLYAHRVDLKWSWSRSIFSKN
jgi:nucleotidyltransferase/DNA polymerase involved in DNA repair